MDFIEKLYDGGINAFQHMLRAEADLGRSAFFTELTEAFVENRYFDIGAAKIHTDIIHDKVLSAVFTASV